MSIADEVKAVLQEVGSPITIRKWNGVLVTGEFFDSTSHTDNTNPSVRSFFLDFSLHHPTSVVVGDTIIWGVSPNTTELIVTALAPQYFAGEVVEYIASGYVINTSGAFWHYNQETESAGHADLDEFATWQVLYSGIEIHGAIMDQSSGFTVKPIAENSMDVLLESLQLFVSSQFTNVKMGMQWRSTAGRVFKVDHIEDNNLLGLRVISLSEETRP